MKTLYLHGILALLSTYLISHQALPERYYNAISAALIFLLIFWGLWLTSWLYHKRYFVKLPKAVAFAAFFLKEVLQANLRIAYDIITPRYHMRPTVIALPLSITSDVEITLLSCLISLTPGSLVIDLSEDRQTLYVHVLYVKDNDVERIKHSIKYGFERRLMELTA